MEELFYFLHSIENTFVRTLFNFHLTNSEKIGDVYGSLQQKISETDIFSDIVSDEHLMLLKKIVYCDINITKHLINHAAYDNYKSKPVNKRIDKFFDVNTKHDNRSNRTADIFCRENSSLVSYIKTTSKKHKIDYGEIKKTINNAAGCTPGYFSGRKGDEYLSTLVKADKKNPWIKSISKHLKIDISNDAIITRGKSSILQTIEFVFVNRTCVKIFKDSTLHFILSKDKTETGCIGIINKLFGTYSTLFTLFGKITSNDDFLHWASISQNITTATTFKEKMMLIHENNIYGIHNFKVGMFNLSYIQPIAYTVFPSMLTDSNKIKIFKGKKLNLVAIRSLEECKQSIEQAQQLLEIMKQKAQLLDSINVNTALIETLKKILI
ncbi:VITF-3 [Sea otter poxvirus]|uniref:Intermediate transcription factor 3 large subunit n=1 Tax=Sea otter poxvirus TaxID=1416741 RepID=A0A2U9QHT4_9POXV|nr:VITF-3 [Sea otter poxvirus]AWU47158.1 VITF-3 [Sea otter poxvirus]